MGGIKIRKKEMLLLSFISLVLFLGVFVVSSFSQEGAQGPQEATPSLVQQEGTSPEAGQGIAPPAGAVQKGGKAEAEEEKKEAGEKKEEKGLIAKLIEAYKVGDWPMHFILLFFLVILAFSIERIIAIYFVYGKNPAKTFDEVKAAFEEGGLDRALEVAKQNSNLPIGAIMYSALRVVKEGNPSNINEEEIKELVSSAVEEEFLRFVPKIQRRVPLIHIFANTAVLLGLLGAVVGLIEAFSGVGAMDPAQRQIYLSKSIAIVMHSTAFGLIAAITGVILFAIISSRANNLVATLEEYAVRASNWVALMAIHSARKLNKEQSKSASE
jgi:biopolymer transport protein ExbB/TolQ